jgi:hypothetical protein
MNDIINDLKKKSYVDVDMMVRRFSSDKFAELIIQEHIKLLTREWRELNNEETSAEMTPRDIGFKVGQKSEIIVLIEKIKKHFGVNE